MHLEELEKLENAYNISLSEQDKLYMIANQYTLVIHKDGTYTLIKGHKINESCSGFKYLGIHSTEGKKIVDLNDHSLKGDNLLGNVYSNDDCGLEITTTPSDFIVHATEEDYSYLYFSPFLSGKNDTIPTITAILENDSIKQLLKLHYSPTPGTDGLGCIWPGLQNTLTDKEECGVPAVIQPVLCKGYNVVRPPGIMPAYDNYTWIYDSSLKTYITSDVWSKRTVSEYNGWYEPSGGMNVHVVVNNEWVMYNSDENSFDYHNAMQNLDSWFVNSMYIVEEKNWYKDGSANFIIFSKDIIIVPNTCNKIIFEMNRYPTYIKIVATVVDTNAPGPQPTSTLIVKEYYNSNKNGTNIFNTTPFTSQSAFKCFNDIVLFAVESPVTTKYNNLKVKFSVSESSLIVKNSTKNNIINKCTNNTDNPCTRKHCQACNGPANCSCPGNDNCPCKICGPGMRCTITLGLGVVGTCSAPCANNPKGCHCRCNDGTGWSNKYNKCVKQSEVTEEEWSIVLKDEQELNSKGC